MRLDTTLITHLFVIQVHAHINKALVDLGPER